MTSGKTVFMFSGQGSQYFQMGRALFTDDAVFRSSMLRMDVIVRDLCGMSVVEELYSPNRSKAESFTRTALTHPALFMVEYSLAQSLLQAGVVPDMTLGASLGSFAAAAISGMVTAEDALTAVTRQATILEACCEPGGMLAILAEPGLLREDFLSRRSVLAGSNFSSHFVVSARRQDLTELEQALQQRGITYQRLPVCFAFHSPWIEPAREPFESFMRSVRYESGRLPMMCCERGAALTSLPEGYFWSVTRNVIRFSDAIAALEREGCHRYIDVGPAGTLATFLKYGLSPQSRSTVQPILTPYGQDLKNLTAVRAGFVRPEAHA